MTIDIPIVSTYKDKGVKQAQNSLDKLAGSAKKLGLALGLALSVGKVVAFGKSSVAEFLASEKAAASLQNTLKNTGNLLAFPDAEKGIKNLAMLSGIADDSLMPLFSQLYLATGDISKAMKDLNLAIDVSRGSSNELGTVVDALSKGYAGNTKSLGNLNLGLSKAYLATGDMVGIQTELNKTFSGASAAYLDTYAGKIAVLNNQWNETKEIVGQGLVMAFQEATGNNGIGGMTSAMETFGYTIDAVLIKLGKASTGNFLDTLGLGFINATLSATVKGWNYLLGVDETRLAIQNEIWKANTKTYELAAKTAADQAMRNKEYLAFLAKQKKLTNAAATAAKKKAAEEKALKQASSLFNMDEIQIFAALQNQITDNEKLRLSLQLALLQNNASEAEKLATQLAISQLQTTNLAQAISKIPKALNPFEGWGSEIDNLLAKMIQMYKLLQTPTTAVITNPSTSSTALDPNHYDSQGRYIGTPFGQAGSNVSTLIGSSGGYDMGLNYVGTPFGQAGSAPVVNNYTINGATADLVEQLRLGLLDLSAQGSFSTINSRA